MAILNLEEKNTPVRPRAAVEPDLDYVSKALLENAAPRDYSSILEPKLILSPLSGPCTPPPIDPLHPLQYFSYLADRSLQILQHGQPNLDYRASIESRVYWTSEAKFFSQDVPNYEAQRQKIENSYYWRCEANHWRSERNICAQEDRFSIGDCTYWRIELEHMVPKTRLEERRKIPDLEYWRIEQWHYNELLQLQDAHLRISNLTTPQVSPTPAELDCQLPPSTRRSSLKRKRAAVESDDSTVFKRFQKLPRKIKSGVSYCPAGLKKPKETYELEDAGRISEDARVWRTRRRSSTRSPQVMSSDWLDTRASPTLRIAESPPCTD